MPETPSQINLLHLILDASLVVQGVMVLLLIASILCWMLIFSFSKRLRSAESEDAKFEQLFSGSVNYKLISQRARGLSNISLSAIFQDAYDHFNTNLIDNKQVDLKDQLERVLRVSLDRKQNSLESGLSSLASIGSVSPYIGLFGTVWGIMNAFLGLSLASQASLASVAPGIAEALIATAMGLFAAIPAVLAFNHFSARLERLHSTRALMCDEIAAALLLEASLADA
jgi:biopolymer transport protein TolQ